MDRVVAGSDAGFNREPLPARSRREPPGCTGHGLSTPATANDDAGIPLGVRPATESFARVRSRSAGRLCIGV